MHVFTNFNDFLITVYIVNLALKGLINGDIIEKADRTLFCYFLSVSLLKLFTYGARNIIQDKGFLLEAAINSFTTAEIILMSSQSLETQQNYGRILSALKVLRISRLFHSFRITRMILHVLEKSMSSFMYLAALILILNVTYAIFGIKLFKNSFNKHKEDYYMFNFDTFLSAFMSIFNLMILDNWSVLLAEGWESRQGPIFASMFVISWMFIGNFLLMSLLQAIILDIFVDGIKEFYEEESQITSVFEKETPSNSAIEETGEKKSKKGKNM